MLTSLCSGVRALLRFCNSARAVVIVPPRSLYRVRSAHLQWRRTTGPIADLQYILTVFSDMSLVLDQSIAEFLFSLCCADAGDTRSVTSITRWKRSSSFSTIMLNGVVASLLPQICKRAFRRIVQKGTNAKCRQEAFDEAARIVELGFRIDSRLDEFCQRQCRPRQMPAPHSVLLPMGRAA